ncbi:MAG: peptide chain release factor N(5)-glutamine methyltransferase [Lachnospiraceae bacterium]|nr:peptide chain release factor N(5)-glutamine methyltransferase [Lachnospiraceae bacterium]
MTFKEILELGAETLKEAGIEEYKSDAMLLLEYVFDIDRAKYFLLCFDEADDVKVKEYKEAIAKRSNRIPLQHITGIQNFMGYDFIVSKDVLIPRLDTEVVTETAINAMKSVNSPEILDICTGSGCIAIALTKLVEGAKVTAVDISKAALCIAEENNKKHDAGVTFIESDIFENVPTDSKFDLIISNPPYIKTEVIEGLMSEVKDFEPMLALDGSEDGLKFYRIISKEASNYLKAGGVIVYEIGYDQGDDVAHLLTENGFKDVEVRKDLAGLDRVVIGRWMPYIITGKDCYGNV